MCPEKGLDTLVEAFIRLRQRNRILHLKLRVGGGCGPGDAAFVRSLQARLQAKRYLSDVEFHPNLDRTAKQEFFRSLTVMSVPALYGEAFGLYLLEAMASGVPVVQPRHGAFEELVEATGGGVLCEPGSPEALADALEALLQDPAQVKRLAARGKETVHRDYSMGAMAARMVREFETLLVRERVRP
jgi:glycosyltransferase involved in cell wall biosynthesis